MLATAEFGKAKLFVKNTSKDKNTYFGPFEIFAIIETSTVDLGLPQSKSTWAGL